MDGLAPKPETYKIGLRFGKKEAPKLRALADRVKAADLTGDVSCFEQAAIAADIGEPLVVTCTDVEEAHQLVAGYILNGIERPAIEELNG